MRSLVERSPNLLAILPLLIPAFVATIFGDELLLVQGLEQQQQQRDVDDDNWNGWKCDDLTPDLCEDLEVSTGTVPMNDGLFVKYWKYSASSTNTTTTTSSSSKLPIIVVHGGPGFCHNYMLPLKQQACRNRDVYFYDQTGCGESIIPSTNNTSDFPYLLDPQYYATVELPKLIEHWNLTLYHVLGNSWGTILAQYFELNTRPSGLVSMTLSGPLSDGDLYIDSQWDPTVGNLGNLPPYVQRRIRALEAHQQYDSKEYQAIDNTLTGFFTVRTDPAPDCWVESVEGSNQDIYVGMQGPSEFSFGGTLSHFNTTARLPTIRVPVLLTSGTFDTMRPPVVDALYQTIPKVEWTMLNHSGHVSMIDDAGWMNDIVEDFLNRVEHAVERDEDFLPNPKACGPQECVSKYKNNNFGSAKRDATTNKHYYPLSVVVVSFIVGAVASWLSLLTFNVGGRADGYQAL
jgi:proline-specific peptidase